MNYLPAIRHSYQNLDVDVIFVPTREIGDEFHCVLICPVRAMIITMGGYTENSHVCSN